MITAGEEIKGSNSKFFTDDLEGNAATEVMNEIVFG